MQVSRRRERTEIVRELDARPKTPISDGLQRPSYQR